MEGTVKIKSHSLKSVLFQWETMILVIFVIMNVVNINLSSNYLNFNDITNNMVVLMDKVLVVFITMMVLLLREIDISMAPIMCLSGCCTGVAFGAGLPIVPAVMAGLLMGVTCGFSNGILLVALPGLNSTIVALGSQIPFRGVAYMILEDKPTTSIPSKMSFLAWSKAAGIPLTPIVSLVETLIFAFVIHRTKFGRFLYAIGGNTKVSRFSGIKTSWIKVPAFILSGLCAGFAGLFLISKLGGAGASITGGYGTEAAAMTILGGASTAGGKDKVLGAVPGVFSIGFLRCGLGTVDVLSQIPMIVIGALPVAVVTIPNLKKVISESASGGWTGLRVMYNRQK